MMRFVRKINFIDGYKISITFNDKKTKIVDLESYLDKGVFLPLRDHEYFKLVKVKYDTLVWPNEADFCPDVLYKIGVEIKPTTKKMPPKRKKSTLTSSEKPQTRIAAKSK